MYIPARERRLLKLLLNEQDHLDVRELASSLDVSTRTIQRDLKGLGGVMSDYDLTLHKDVSNRYYIHGAQEHLTRLKVDLASLEPSEFTPEERQLLLLVALLEKQEPVKLFFSCGGTKCNCCNSQP
jgi:mannitol operon transcriptional antiterminator